MSISFNADEILEMAEQIERNGARFYRRAAEQFDDEKVRRALLGLAMMEDQHEKTFASMRAGLGGDAAYADTFDPDGEAAAYLRAMADGYLFDVRTDPCEKLTGSESLEDVLKMAIGLEKDSVLFYLGLRNLVREKGDRDRVEAIIEEELKHAAMLSQQLAALKR